MFLLAGLINLSIFYPLLKSHAVLDCFTLAIGANNIIYLFTVIQVIMTSPSENPRYKVCVGFGSANVSLPPAT